MKTLSKSEKRELKLSANPLRKLRADLRNQGTTLEEFLDLCYSCGLNPLPMLREEGINIRYYKDTSYCDVSVHYSNINGREQIILNYPDYESRWNEWCRFNNRYHNLLNLAEERKIQRGLNRPHRVLEKKIRY